MQIETGLHKPMHCSAVLVEAMMKIRILVVWGMVVLSGQLGRDHIPGTVLRNAPHDYF